MSGCAAPAPAGSGHSTRVLPAASVVVSGCGTCWQPASSAQPAIAAMDVVFMVPKPTPAPPAAAYLCYPDQLKPLLQRHWHCHSAFVFRPHGSIPRGLLFFCPLLSISF